MAEEMFVIKRNGEKQSFQLEKWQEQIALMCEGIDGVSPSTIELQAQPFLKSGITTRELDEQALRAMMNLIDEEEHPEVGNINYQYVAGKQRITMLRKDVYGSYKVPRLYDIVKKNVEREVYTHELLEWYTEAEWDQIDSFVDHDKDENMPYAAVEQMIGKYLVQNRVTEEVFESPQVRYAIAAATAFHAEKKNRLRWVKDFYNGASDGDYTLATPVLAGLGTTTKQFSSCVVIKVGDSLPSIYAAGEVMGNYAAKRAGIGFDLSAIRALGAEVRGGQVFHTGIFGFMRKWYGDLRCCCLTPDMWVEIRDPACDGFIQTHKFVQMRDVQIGDKIKTINEYGNIIFKEITDKFNTWIDPHKQVKLTFKNGVVINCSINHPIMVYRNGRTFKKYPEELQSSDTIICTNEQGKVDLTFLEKAEFGQTNEPFYIDITVEDVHTFFTTHDPSLPMILTHNSQGGIRNASATFSIPIWHHQFDDFIVLKNNQGTEENRIRHLDYSVTLSQLFWKRFKNRGDITFFDPHDVPELYKAFYSDIDLFDKLYVEYEKRDDIRKKVISAEVVFKDWILKERGDTGRIYLLNIDNVQKQTPYDVILHPIYQSNLCQEILIPSKEFERVEDEEGLVGLCTLSSLNWGNFRNPDEIKKSCRLLQRALHNLLQYQDFLTVQSARHNEMFEPIGVGVTNVAYWHAKRKMKYGSPEALAEVKRWMEHQLYYLIEASADVSAEEDGKTPSAYHTTWYAKGVFPWERRSKHVNELTDFTPSEDLDWEGLRERIKVGMANTVLVALPPVESSSVVINSTNGINMVKNLIVNKKSAAGTFSQVVPEYRKFGKYYEKIWDQEDCLPYLKMVAVMTPYTDQGISADTFYNPKFFTEQKIPATLIANNLMLCSRWGVKSHYYDLRPKEKFNVEEPVYLPDPLDLEDEEACESCVL